MNSANAVVIQKVFGYNPDEPFKYFKIGDDVIGHLHITHHPTIPYEVFDTVAFRSKRCYTEDEPEEFLRDNLSAR